MGVRRYLIRAVYTVPRYPRLQHKLLIGAICMISTVWYLAIYPKGTSVSVVDFTLEDIPFSNYEPFQPEVDTDFPTVYNSTPRIPHIIHQYNDPGTLIPAHFVENVKSCVHLNPLWTYYFWTENTVRNLVAERHPYLLQIWDNYESRDDRADVTRYVVLYEFGGIFIDMDFQCLRPLDRVTIKYSCIFPPQPFEQSVFGNHVPFSLTNAVILCRPKHPFLQQILRNLLRSRVFIERLDATGPAFVSLNYLMYNNINDMYMTKSTNESNSPYFYKGELPEYDINAVYVPNSVYFFDRQDEDVINQLKYINICTDFYNIDALLKRGCIHTFGRGFQRRDNSYAYTRQHRLVKLSGQRSTELSAIVPHYRTYVYNELNVS